MSYRMAALNKNLIIIIACLLKKKKELRGLMELVWNWGGFLCAQVTRAASGMLYVYWEHDTMIYEPTLCLVAYKFIASKTVLKALYEEIMIWARGRSNPGKSHICCCLFSLKPWRINTGFTGVRMRKEWRKILPAIQRTSLHAVSTGNTEQRGCTPETCNTILRGNRFYAHVDLSSSYFPEVRHMLESFELEL